MTRSSVSLGLLVGAVTLGGSVAAEPVSSGYHAYQSYGTDRVVVEMPPSAFATPHATVSRVLFLNRCAGGCVIHSGGNDARTQTSAIPVGAGPFNVSAYAWGDAEWAQVVQCMKEVYSPFNVMVTDVQPTSGSWHEALIAGDPSEVGLDAGILGIAPLA